MDKGSCVTIWPSAHNFGPHNYTFHNDATFFSSIKHGFHMNNTHCHPELLSGFQGTSELRNEQAAKPPATKFYSEAYRLQTFDKNWLDDYFVKPRDLARDGFVYIGPKDKVKCVFCLRTIQNWQPSDCVEREHRRHYPDCPFVRGLCDQMNIPLCQPSTKKFVGMECKQQAAITESAMMDYTNRLKSYHSWPQNAPMRPDELAEVGFFYLGNGDRVKCFSCKKVISHWQPEDIPLVEHAKWSPNCTFIRTMKSHNFLHPVKDVKNPEGQLKMPNKSRVTDKNLPSAVKSMDVEQPKESFEVHPSSISLEQIERDLKSTAAHAMLQGNDISVERLTQLLQHFRLTKGTSCNVTVEDLMDIYSQQQEFF